jgi:hypothetical protein
MRKLWFLVAVAGCPGETTLTTAPADDPMTGPPYTGDHPIDRVLHPRFVREGITVTAAPNAELCRRLYADLLGRFPSKSEIEADCGSRTVEEIATDFQSREAYLYVAERHWHDRLSSGETFTDWRYLTDLYARVHDLHTGRLRYDDFAREVITHPGFSGSVEVIEDKVDLAFRAFAGRKASPAERTGLAPLFFPWYVDELPDPDFPYVMVLRVAFDPSACDFGRGCATDLFGGAAIALDDEDLEAEPVLYEDLDPDRRRRIQAAGYLIASQPFFAEAAADEILDRLLAYSDGGRTPRRSGVLLPEVRQVLAEHLAATGDYPSAERLVITSWLYTMATEGIDPAAPVYASGPIKAAPAEVWLDTVLRHTGLRDIEATCEYRYMGNDAEFVLYDAFEMGLIGEQQLQADTARLHGLMEDRRPLGDEGVDDTYAYFAEMIGGCTVAANRRIAADGLAFAYAQEALAGVLCDEGFAGEASDVASALEGQMPALLGRDPSAEDSAEFDAAARACSADDCGPERAGALVCSALSGSAEMLFY